MGNQNIGIKFNEDFKKMQEAKWALFQYIEGWYNRKRMHGSIGYKTRKR